MVNLQIPVLSEHSKRAILELFIPLFYYGYCYTDFLAQDLHFEDGKVVLQELHLHPHTPATRDTRYSLHSQESLELPEVELQVLMNLYL